MNGRSLTGHEASVGPEIFVGVLARERHRDGKRMLSEEVSTDGPGDRFAILVASATFVQNVEYNDDHRIRQIISGLSYEAVPRQPRT